MDSTVTIERPDKGKRSSSNTTGTFLGMLRGKFGSSDNPFAPSNQPLIDVLSRILDTPVAVGPKDGQAKPKPIICTIPDRSLILGYSHYPETSLAVAMVGDFESSSSNYNMMIDAPRRNPFQAVNAKFSDCISSPTFALIEFETGKDIVISVSDDAFMITRTKKQNSAMSDPKAADTPADLASAIKEFCQGKTVNFVAVCTGKGDKTELVITLTNGDVFVADSEKPVSIC